MKNRYGLDRHIPESTKRIVRQRDGFGCVVCGCALIQYDHFEPPFNEAREHDPKGILLLCPNCHSKKGRFLSEEQIKEAAICPKATQAGFASDTFLLGKNAPRIALGQLTTTNTPHIINIFGENVISLQSAESPGGPIRLSANIRGTSGQEILRIVENEWQVPVNNWDVSVVGRDIVIREKSGGVNLHLQINLPNTLIFKRMDFRHRDVRVYIDVNNRVRVEHRGMAFDTGGGEISDYEAGLVVDESGVIFGRGGGSGSSFTLHNVRIGRSAPMSRSVEADFSGWSWNSVKNGPFSAQQLDQHCLVIRNKPCMCGSGSRFKHCHGRLK